MISSEEHREACRVYMQKYRSKPENREKIRQQNAEYRKRKKMESIRQVSEIGSLETVIDSQSLRVKLLEQELRQSKSRIELLEKESKIPGHYMSIIDKLQQENDIKQQQLNQFIAVLQEIPASNDMSATQYHQSIIANLQNILKGYQEHNTNDISSATTSPSSSPLHISQVHQQRQQMNNSSNSISTTTTPTNPTKRSKSSHYQQPQQNIPSLSLNPNIYSSPPSSPSLQFPTSPRNTNIPTHSLSGSGSILPPPFTPPNSSSPSTPTSTPSMSPFQSQSSFRLVPDSLNESNSKIFAINSSPRDYIQQQQQQQQQQKNNNNTNQNNNNNNNSVSNLSLLCDVLEECRPQLQQPQSSSNNNADIRLFPTSALTSMRPSISLPLSPLSMSINQLLNNKA